MNRSLMPAELSPTQRRQILEATSELRAVDSDLSALTPSLTKSQAEVIRKVRQSIVAAKDRISDVERAWPNLGEMVSESIHLLQDAMAKKVTDRSGELDQLWHYLKEIHQTINAADHHLAAQGVPAEEAPRIEVGG